MRMSAKYLVFCSFVSISFIGLLWKALNHSQAYSTQKSVYEVGKTRDSYGLSGHVRSGSQLSSEVTEDNSKTFLTKIIYNRVGKCGSRSMLAIIRELSDKNKFLLYTSSVFNVTRPSILDLQAEVKLIDSLMSPVIYSRHIHFIDFSKFGAQTPVYINMIRDPIERFLSNYYFRRFGDSRQAGPRQAKQWLPGDRSRSVNECILRNHSECSGIKLWYIVPYFCGHELICKRPSREALSRAKVNLLDHYMAVGILEDFEGTLNVFEKLFPRFFTGAAALWKEIEAARQNTKTLGKTSLSPKAYSVLRNRMDIEYEFYNFALALFQHLKDFHLGIK